MLDPQYPILYCQQACFVLLVQATEIGLVFLVKHLVPNGYIVFCQRWSHRGKQEQTQMFEHYLSSLIYYVTGTRVLYQIIHCFS